MNMDREYSQFEFLSKYDQEIVIQYLGSLHLCEFNSPFASRQSRLIIQALINCDGTEKINDSFGNLIKENYRQEFTEDPQEYLYVDCVHSTKRTYRVFPGLFANFHNNLTRLFELSDKLSVKSDDQKLVNFLLELSDIIAGRMGYVRYTLGNPQAEEIVYLDIEKSRKISQNLIFSREEISQIAYRNGLSYNDICVLLYVHCKQKLIDFELKRQGYSPVETNPLYKLNNGSIFVIQPSALLSAAHRIMINSLKKLLPNSFSVEYHKELTIDLTHCTSETKESNKGYGDIDDGTFLLFRVDKDKLLVVIIVSDIILSNMNSCVLPIKSFFSQQFAKDKIHYIFTHNSLELGVYYEVKSDYILVDFDDLKVMLSLKDLSLRDIWYYCEDRANLNVKLIGQEIDLFASYLQNKHTFYTEVTYTTIISEIGNALGLRYNVRRNRDVHYLVFKGKSYLMEHYFGFPITVPLYLLCGSHSQYEQFGELRNSSIRFCIDRENPYSTLCCEISKSILIWLYAIEYRFNKAIIFGDIQIVIDLSDDKETTLLCDCQRNWFKFTLSLKSFHAEEDIRERYILYQFLSRLYAIGVTVDDSFIDMIFTVFSESHGAILQMCDYDDILLENDGHMNFYSVNDRCCDFVLTEIANHLNLKGKEIILDGNESKKIALKIQDFLGKKIDMILKVYSNALFYQLLELHHSLQYWKFNSINRFYSIDSVFRYVGEKFENQLQFADIYTETDNLTTFIIERIVRNNFISMQGVSPSLEEIDMLYAYAKQYYIICQYLDLASTGRKDATLTILKNGRFTLPVLLLNKYLKYFRMLREEEYNNVNYKKIKSELFPEYSIQKNDDAFYRAFMEEFDLSYDSYINICKICIDFSADQGGIACMKVADFSHLVSTEINKFDYNIFKDKFILSKDVASKISKYSEFYPHRYNRVFQVSSRPWIEYHDHIYFSSKSISTSSRILLDRICNAVLVAQSPGMKSYLGTIRDRKGHDFNSALFKYVKDHASSEIVVKLEVKICQGKTLDADKDYGDIDLLIIDTKSKIIKCVEAKDFVESRYLWQLLDQEKKIIGALPKVCSRDNWCRNNIRQFSKICHLVDDSYTIQTVFLTYNLQPETFDKSGPYKNIKFVSLIDLIKDPKMLL